MCVWVLGTVKPCLYLSPTCEQSGLDSDRAPGRVFEFLLWMSKNWTSSHLAFLHLTQKSAVQKKNLICQTRNTALLINRVFIGPNQFRKSKVRKRTTIKLKTAYQKSEKGQLIGGSRVLLASSKIMETVSKTGCVGNYWSRESACRVL